MKFADLHIHSTLKPYIFYAYKPESEKGNIWYQDKPKSYERDDFLVRYSEADFTTLAQSGVKIAFLAFYPFEQGWFNSTGENAITEFIDHIYTGFPLEAINYISARDYNYFQRLKFEYTFLEEQIKNPHQVDIDGEKVFVSAKIPKNKTEFSQFLQEDNTLVIIPTIEGAHSLINGNAANVDNLDTNEILSNIDYLKNSHLCPFFITLGHHFYNGMCGQAQSLFSYSKFKQKIINWFLDQSKGLNQNLNQTGFAVVKKLLAIDEFKGEKRILVDIKHMNSDSRKQFYTLVGNYNKNNPDDKIPIIASHMGYSGKRDFNSTHNIKVLASLKPFTASGKFDGKSINLSDFDVVNIFESGGLIGVNLDQKIISSKRVIKRADRKFSDAPTDRMQYYWAKQIVENITQMANAVIKRNYTDKEKVWDMFTIGSDFDGFIDPVDAFITTNDYPRMQEFIAKALDNNKIFKNNSYGLSSAELAHKIMYKNAEFFLNEHYWQKNTEDNIA